MTAKLKEVKFYNECWPTGLHLAAQDAVVRRLMRIAWIQQSAKVIKFLACALLLCGLTVACGKESELRSMHDLELAERHAGCLDREPTAPGRVQACKNIKRECDRRKEDLGLYVCRSQ